MVGNEQFNTWNKANVDTALDVARLTLSATERLAALNLEASKAVLADFHKSSQGFDVKDLQDVSALRNKFAEAGWNRASTYTRAAYEVFANVQSELAAAFEQRVAEIHHQYAGALDKAAKSAPAGTEPLVGLLKSGLAASASAFDTSVKAARQFTNLAEAGVKAAAANVNGAAKAASKK